MKKPFHNHDSEGSSKAGSQKKPHDDQRFWRALKSEQQPATDVQELTDLSQVSEEEREHRRRALRSMLAANEARQQQIQRSRLPALAAGIRITVRSEVDEDREATIQDADFIHSRVLVDLDDGKGKQWVEFSRLAPARPESESDDQDNIIGDNHQIS